jgi:hypothetical protein
MITFRHIVAMMVWMMMDLAMIAKDHRKMMMMII